MLAILIPCFCSADTDERYAEQEPLEEVVRKYKERKEAESVAIEKQKEAERIAREEAKAAAERAEKERLEAAKQAIIKTAQEKYGPHVNFVEGRLVAFDSGIAMDIKTGIMWPSQKNKKNKPIFGENYEAEAAIASYRGGGYSDWRFPTKKELGTIDEVTDMLSEYDDRVEFSTGGCSVWVRIDSDMIREYDICDKTRVKQKAIPSTVETVVIQNSTRCRV